LSWSQPMPFAGTEATYCETILKRVNMWYQNFEFFFVGPTQRRKQTTIDYSGALGAM
jgi:hypothetical protein